MLVHRHQLQPSFIHEPQGVGPVHVPQVLALFVQQQQVALLDLPAHTADGGSCFQVLFLFFLLLLWFVIDGVSIVTCYGGEQRPLLRL